ncbi:MAG: hypothetical protein Q9224_000643, partial [Gallowayella concinna]
SGRLEFTRSQVHRHALLPGYWRVLDNDRRLFPNRIQSKVSLPVHLTLVQQLPVEVPYHLREDDASLHVPHVLSDTSTRPHREGQPYPLLNEVSVYRVPGTDSGKSESAISMQSQCLFDHAMKIWKRLQPVIRHLRPTRECSTYLISESFVCSRILEEVVHCPGEKIGIGIKPAHNQMEVIRWDRLVLWEQQRKVVRMAQVFLTSNAVLNYTQIGPEKGRQRSGQLGGQSQEDQGIEERKSLHYLVERAPQSNPAESSQKQMSSGWNDAHVPGDIAG